jgi:DNA-binding transcriptional ArsR family regulator
MPSPNAVFRALADPTRREILQQLRAGPRSSGDIAAQFPSAWATISRHLGVLRDAELILAERDGNSIRYELNTTVLQEFVKELLDLTQPGAHDDA